MRPKGRNPRMEGRPFGYHLPSGQGAAGMVGGMQCGRYRGSVVSEAGMLYGRLIGAGRSACYPILRPCRVWRRMCDPV